MPYTRCSPPSDLLFQVFIEKRKIAEEADSKNPTEVVEGKSDINAFQVLRREYSSHKYAANIGFSLARGAIKFNMACLRFYPDTNYVQILIDERGKRIAIRKCGQYDKDAMQWAYNKKKDGKRNNRDIRTDIACARVYDMMAGDWEDAYAYKVLGTRKIYDDADIVIFMLDEGEGFETTYYTDENGNRKRKVNSFLPARWQDSFGDYVEEHDRKQEEGLMETIKLFNTPDGGSYLVQPKTRGNGAEPQGEA